MLSKIEYSQIRLSGFWAGNDFPALILVSQGQGLLWQPGHPVGPSMHNLRFTVQSGSVDGFSSL